MGRGGKNFIDLTGQVFGRWTVIRRAENRNERAVFLCRCACGVEREVRSADLKNGSTVSCGCYSRELTLERSLKHGMAKRGQKKPPEYGAWSGIIKRCKNPNCKEYKNYGGRGIKVCARWEHSFESFLADMGQRPSSKHSIDRIDVNGDYEPSNCRWATILQQANNKRDNRRVQVGNTTMTVSEAARLFGVNCMAIITRLNSGWDVMRAITQPVHPTKRSKGVASW